MNSMACRFVGIGLLMACSVDPIPYRIDRSRGDAGSVNASDVVAPSDVTDPSRSDVVQPSTDVVSLPDVVPAQDVPFVQPTDVVQPGPDVFVCVRAGGTCRIDRDCCTQVCAGTQCLPSSQGERCVTSADCIFTAPCSAGMCQCQVAAGRCSYDSECCSMMCNTDSHFCE